MEPRVSGVDATDHRGVALSWKDLDAIVQRMLCRRLRTLK